MRKNNILRFLQRFRLSYGSAQPRPPDFAKGAEFLIERAYLRGCNGHTLVEVLIAGAISGLVIISSMTGFIYAARLTRSGGYQVQFTAQARAAGQRIARYIEEGKAVGVVSNRIINIVTPEMRRARIYYEDPVPPRTTGRIMYQADFGANSTPYEICRHVTPVLRASGVPEPIFEIVPSSPSAVRIVFHVGDAVDGVSAGQYSMTGYGYQGQEIRISATPRNLQRWYD